jgi:hypothetical protein
MTPKPRIASGYRTRRLRPYRAYVRHARVTAKPRVFLFAKSAKIERLTSGKNLNESSQVLVVLEKTAAAKHLSASGD